MTPLPRLAAFALVLSLQACHSLSPSLKASKTAVAILQVAEALERYAIDEAWYPNTESIQSPDGSFRRVYLPYVMGRSANLRDGWGRELKVTTTHGPETGAYPIRYIIVSPGADGLFDPESWLQAGEVTPRHDDFVFQGSIANGACWQRWTSSAPPVGIAPGLLSTWSKRCHAEVLGAPPNPSLQRTRFARR